MSFTIALAQCKRPDDGDVIASSARWIQQAAESGADLIVFPEALMTKFDGSAERFAAQSQPADGSFAQAFDALAIQHKIWIVYTLNERNPNGGLPFNTAIAVDPQGTHRAHYRKVHLFDAQGHLESERMAAGDSLLEPFSAPFARIGMGICYDLRFPETALHAALGGAQIMLYPAAWVGGPGKIMQWETLLRARAIENGIFVAGCCSADEGRIGHSRVFGPDGRTIASGGAAEELVTCEIDLSEINRVRTTTPSLQHRRPDCYPCM